MGKEQELRPDLQQRLVTALYGPNIRRSDTVEELADALIAISMARRSSDEQAEVAGDQRMAIAHAILDLATPEPSTERQLAENSGICRAANVVRNWCNPPSPAVAAGGVTDQAVEVACKAFYGEAAWQFPRGIISKPSSIIAMRRALTAALAVREGWQPIETAPPAMHVMACRFDHEAGEWVYDVVMSPPIYPFTHWRMLDAPPSRGEGV